MLESDDCVKLRKCQEQGHLNVPGHSLSLDMTESHDWYRQKSTMYVIIRDSIWILILFFEISSIDLNFVPLYYIVCYQFQFCSTVLYLVL